MKSDTKLYYTKYNIRKQKKKYNYVTYSYMHHIQSVMIITNSEFYK